LLYLGAEKISYSTGLITVCIIRCNSQHAHDLQRYPGSFITIFANSVLVLMLMFINCVPVQFDTAVQEKVPTIVILDYDITKC